MGIRQKVESNLYEGLRIQALDYGYNIEYGSPLELIEDFCAAVAADARRGANGNGIAYLAQTIRAYVDIAQAKTILFQIEQMDVFAKIQREFTDALDYRLPFPEIFIQFSRPWRTALLDPEKERVFLGMVLSQRKVDNVEYENLRRRWGESLYPIDFNVKDDIYLNWVYTIAQDGEMASVAWQSDTVHHKFADNHDLIVNANLLQNLAIACIGYINCENVYLEKQGEVSEAVNRKREAKGKGRLEPYYVCRVRGVQYDSHATGEGSKHGVRYDVRGHFRRLETGKTLWVRPHQRGLQNELYVPKVYRVAQDSKPAWKPDEE